MANSTSKIETRANPFDIYRIFDSVDWEDWKLANKTDRGHELVELFGQGKKPALAWGLPHSVFRDAISLFVDDNPELDSMTLESIDQQRIQDLIEKVDGDRDSLTQNSRVTALQMVFAAQHLVSIAGQLAESDWLKVADSLLQLSGENDFLLSQDPVAAQYLSVEIPLTIAFLMVDIEELDPVANDAVDRFASSMESLLDSNGLIQAKHVGDAWWLLGIWTRCRLLMDGLLLGFDSEDDDIQFEWFVRQCLQTQRPNGTPVFGPDDTSCWSRRMFRAAIQFSDEPQDHALLDNFSAAKTNLAPIEFDCHEIGACSEWGKFAVLRGSLRWGLNQVAVTFAEKNCELEICNQSHLIQTRLNPQIKLKQQACQQSSEWNVNLWHQDEDVELLEIEAQFGPATIQRQFLLSREDEFLFFADAVFLNEASELTCQLAIDRATSVEILEESETTEVYLTDSGKIRSLILPLHCEEWKNRWSKQNWSCSDGRLEIALAADGRALFLPMLIDLNRKRSRAPRTWRALTVAENRSKCPADHAAGIRVQIGRQQWLFYRSLKQPSNRTVLGQNYSCEFFAGRLHDDGTTEELVTIE